MNHIYKTVWNNAKQAWISVSELGKSKGKGKSAVCLGVAAAAVLAGTMPSAAEAAVGFGSRKGGVALGQGEEVKSSAVASAIALGGVNATADSALSIAIGEQAWVKEQSEGAIALGANASVHSKAANTICQFHSKTEPQLWSKIEPPYERCFIR